MSCKQCKFGSCQYKNHFGVKAPTVKGLSNLTKANLLEFALINDILISDTDEKKDKTRLFNVIKNNYDSTIRALEESTGKKFNRLDTTIIKDSLKLKTVVLPIAKPVKPEKKDLYKWAMRTTPSATEDILNQGKTGRLPAGSKIRRNPLPKPLIREQRMDDLTDMLVGAWTFKDDPLSGMSGLALFGKKNRFG
jgi:hypothetical protein